MARLPVSSRTLPRILRLLLWTLALLSPLLVAGWIAAARVGQEAVLRRAAAQLERGETETSLRTLAPLEARRMLLSGESRRRAAELLFRLGEDGSAHAFLRGQRFEGDSPDDQRLRDLAGRSLQAARLLSRADKSRDPKERLSLLREARELLPEAPRVLQRLVLEEMLAMTADDDPALATAFEEDYTELRRTAPSLAAEVKAQAEKRLGTQES